MKILIKAMRPHRQKVLTEGGEEMRLQQWANKQAASALREAGGDAGGEQFNQARDALMHSAVNNPDEHGLKFMGERVPFDGQELEESLSAPDVEGERASIDAEFAPSEEKPETPDIFDEDGKLRDGTEPEEEEEEFEPDKEAEHLRRIMTSRQVPMRDAWSILKNTLKMCEKCSAPYTPKSWDTGLCPHCEEGGVMNIPPQDRPPAEVPYTPPANR